VGDEVSPQEAQRLQAVSAAETARVVAHPLVTLQEFRAACLAMQAIHSPRLRHLGLLHAHRSRLADAAEADPAMMDHEIVAFVTSLEAGRMTSVYRSAAPEPLARAFGLSVVRCRRLVRVRQVVRELVDTDEHVRQIGYAARYNHASDLNRDFREELGLNPGQFRRLVASVAHSRDAE
jgi:hypothetical protein